MNTLSEQRLRLESEIISAKENIIRLKEERFPDLKAIKLQTETIERNMQLIGMIDNHLRCDHQAIRKEQ